MERETLRTILERAQCRRSDGELYEVKQDQQLTLYLGQPGRAVAVDHVLSVQLADAHVEVEARDRGTFYVAYDAVHILLSASSRERKGTGGNVGF